MSEYAKEVLVETSWVEEHLDDDSIRIVEVDENPALYAESHIPGAIGFDWKLDLQDQLRRDFLGPEAFGELFGSRGISDDHTVVLYGDRNNWFAAYTYWYLKYYGHDKVLLVNGPREKWIAEGRPTSTDVPSYAAGEFNAKPGDAAIRATPRRSCRRARQEDEARRRPLAGGVLGRGDLARRLRAGGRPARRPHPGRGVGAMGLGGQGGRYVQVSKAELEELYTGKGVLTAASRSSPTAGSASARRTRGSCCTSCSAKTTSRTTTARGPSGATSSTSRSRSSKRLERHLGPARAAGPGRRCA